MSAAYDHVITALTEATGYTPRGRATQRSARCPVHDDNGPSLSVGLSPEGKVLMHCHAGCDPVQIWDTLGLLARDLFEEPKERPERTGNDDWIPCGRHGHRKVDEYLYRDEHRAVLYGVARCDRKCFPQWRPNPAARSGRRWSLKDEDGNFAVRLVPFRLPEMLAAVEAERVVWITEGEKDALAVAARPGGVATCSPMGAGKWRPEFAPYFRDADVLICADNDNPGKSHANDVYLSLQPVVASLQVVLPRFGKDAFDHFAAGGTTGDFTSICEYVREGADR